MKKIHALLPMSFAFLLALGAVSPALAALTEVGPVTAPSGYPQYYGDANGLRLQLCQDGDGVNGMCIFDPIDTGNPESVALGVGDESFWWMAVAAIDENTPGAPDGLNAELTLALEGAFGGIGVAKNGDQIAFGRTRIRIDTPAAGTYTVTYPYGVRVFENVPAGKDAIDFTADIGAINVLTPEVGFLSAIHGEIGPFLTWPDYQNDLTLQVDGNQYIGNPQIAHVVTGSTFIPEGEEEPANYFRIQGPNDLDIRTDLFELMGKVLPEPPPAVTPHVFPPPPPANLFAVGPVNRTVPFVRPTTGSLTGIEVPGYPIGFPLWYQENAGTPEAPAGGLKLAVCPPSNLDPMCISAPIDAEDPVSVALGVGEEAFWWSGEASIAEQGLDVRLTLALEAAFGGVGGVSDGDQIAFGRVRITGDVPVAGTYTITHPYGVEVFENVTVADGIKFTRDLGIINLIDPDGAFIGGLYSDIGPRFLTWPDYHLETALQVNGNQYVGDPAVPHIVTGSTFIPQGESQPSNYFRIQGPNGSGIDATTDLFLVSGKVFDPATIPAPMVQACTFLDGRWLIDGNGNGVWEPLLDIIQRFGRTGDQPVTGDWDGDGRTEVGVFRSGLWILDTNGDGVRRAGDQSFIFGGNGDKAVTGDWNGDGVTDIGVVRGKRWILDADGDHVRNAGDIIFQYGLDTDVPVTGDWNGDGVTDIGVFRDGQWILDANGNRTSDAGDQTYQFGRVGDKPVTGDWNFDGRTQIGIVRAISATRAAWHFDDGNGILEPGIDGFYPRFRIPSEIPLICGDGPNVVFTGGAPE